MTSIKRSPVDVMWSNWCWNTLSKYGFPFLLSPEIPAGYHCHVQGGFKKLN
jgi:hypothetical protein